MKKLHLCLWGMILFIPSNAYFVFKGFNFSGKDSTIRVGTGANFIVNKDITNVDGTIDIINHSVDRIKGANTITFQNGVLGRDSLGALFSGVYDVSGNDSIILQGSSSSPHHVYAQGGSLLAQVHVVGQYNKIEGQPVFSEPIIFDGDLQTTLTVGIQNNINKNIYLNSGTLILSDDLSLADDVVISGSGVIKLNHKTLNLPGAHSTWTDTLYFDNATDVELHAKTTLSGVWTFSGENTINGNGSVFDLTGGGVLAIEEGSRLYLNDLMIKGIGSGSLGSFFFQDDAGEILFSNVTIELESTCTTNKGSIYVDGTSTVIVKDHVWWFDEQGSLTVDGVTLWTDQAGAPTIQGLGIKFGVPKDNYYTSVASGTIKTMASGDVLSSLVYSNSNAIVNIYDLVIGNSNAIAGFCDAHLCPGEFLHFSSDQTFDGDGKNLVFSHWDQPQFIVDPGVTVVLKDIELLRINENTFSMGKGSKLQIDSGVVFELSEDTVWKSGKIELIGDGPFSIRGMDGIKKFTFQATCLYDEIMLDLGTSSMILRNIELNGLHLFDGRTRLRDRYLEIVGSIVLDGNVIINLDHTTRMNFVASGENNELRVLENNIGLQGRLSFGRWLENDLHIDFLLDDQDITPRIRFENEFSYITSDIGLAKLIFDDPYVEVYNETENSFVVGDNSYLGGQTIKVLNNPIKQVHPDFAMSSNLELITDLDNAIEQEFLKSPFNPLGIQQNRDVYPYLSYEEIDVEALEKVKSVLLPVECDVKGILSYKPDLFVKYNTIKLSQAKNVIKVHGGQINEFGIDEQQDLYLMLSQGATIKTGNKRTVVKPEDTIEVIGKNNRIVLAKDFVLQGKIIFGKDSELIFEFDSQAEESTLFFDGTKNNLLEIAQGANIVFKGQGSVVLGDGYVIHFQGKSNNSLSTCIVKDRTKLLFEEGTALFSGEGKILVDQKGTFAVNSQQHVVLGGTELDDITFAVDRKGKCIIGNCTSDELSVFSNSARISMQYGQYSVSVKNDGTLFIGNDGLLEINSCDFEQKAGLLQELSFESGGLLHVDQGGLLLFGHNRLTGYRKEEVPFSWKNSGGTYSGEGFVGLLEGGIYAELKNFISGAQTILPKTFVKKVINSNTSLQVSTVFVDQFGKQKVITKDGVLVELLSGDEVIGEDASSGILSVVNNGCIFSITSNGQRI